MTRQFATNYLLHVFFVLGSAMKCNVCRYSTSRPKEQQKCTSAPVKCSSGFCSTLSFTLRNGEEDVIKDCGDASVCRDAEKRCNFAKTTWKLKSCAFACCNTDNCNNYTLSSALSSATGVMVTKFTPCLLVLFLLDLMYFAF